MRRKIGPVARNFRQSRPDPYRGMVGKGPNYFRHFFLRPTNEFIAAGIILIDSVLRTFLVKRQLNEQQDA